MGLVSFGFKMDVMGVEDGRQRGKGESCEAKEAVGRTSLGKNVRVRSGQDEPSQARLFGSSLVCDMIGVSGSTIERRKEQKPALSNRLCPVFPCLLAWHSS